MGELGAKKLEESWKPGEDVRLKYELNKCIVTYVGSANFPIEDSVDITIKSQSAKHFKKVCKAIEKQYSL